MMSVQRLHKGHTICCFTQPFFFLSFFSSQKSTFLTRWLVINENAKSHRWCSLSTHQQGQFSCLLITNTTVAAAIGAEST